MELPKHLFFVRYGGGDQFEIKSIALEFEDLTKECDHAEILPLNVKELAEKYDRIDYHKLHLFILPDSNNERECCKTVNVYFHGWVRAKWIELASMVDPHDDRLLNFDFRMQAGVFSVVSDEPLQCPDHQPLLLPKVRHIGCNALTEAQCHIHPVENNRRDIRLGSDMHQWSVPVSLPECVIVCETTVQNTTVACITYLTISSASG